MGRVEGIIDRFHFRYNLCTQKGTKVGGGGVLNLKVIRIGEEGGGKFRAGIRGEVKVKADDDHHIHIFIIGRLMREKTGSWPRPSRRERPLLSSGGQLPHRR